MTKYLDPPSVETGTGPQISECIRSKGAKENDSLLLKGNFVCLPKWQEVQSKFWNWTEPKWPWEANNWRRDKDGWPRRACHRSGEEIAVVAAAETTCEADCWFQSGSACSKEETLLLLLYLLPPSSRNPLLLLHCWWSWNVLPTWDGSLIIVEITIICYTCK